MKMAWATSARIPLVAFMLSTAINIAFLLYMPYRFKELIPPERVYTYVDDDFPSNLPVRIPSVGLVVEPGDARFSLYADEDWNTLFPPESNGFTNVGPHNRTFATAFVHQMHCLDIFRIGYLTNRTGFAHHFEHCLHYMRQTVLCNADTTMEVAYDILVNGTWKLRANGVGSVHRCKDWTVLRRYLDEHPVTPVRDQNT